MPDDTPAPTGGNDDLILQALLYASGELDAVETEAFERRLSEEQAVRDALCRAVELQQTLVPAALPGPDPAYRTHVRHRLRQRRRQRLALTPASDTWFGHPAFWSFLGAAVAVLLLVLISQLIASLEGHAPPGATAADAGVTPALANFWADQNNTNRLEQVRTEEQARRQRAADRPRWQLASEDPE